MKDVLFGNDNQTLQVIGGDPSQKDTTFSINTENSGIILRAVTKNLYANPEEGAFREIISNAVDSVRKAGTNKISINIPYRNRDYSSPEARPVKDRLLAVMNSIEGTKLTMEELDNNYSFDMSNTLIIRDYGTGIDPEVIEALYTSLFTSTKRDDKDAIGHFGIGSKSPFAISDTFTTINYWNGVRYQYSVVLLEDEARLIPVSETKTNEPNGMCIAIPFHNARMTESLLNVYVGMILSGFSDIDFDITGIPETYVNSALEDNKKEIFSDKVSSLSRKGNTFAYLSGVAYRADSVDIIVVDPETHNRYPINLERNTFMDLDDLFHKLVEELKLDDTNLQEKAVLYRLLEVGTNASNIVNSGCKQIFSAKYNLDMILSFPEVSKVILPPSRDKISIELTSLDEIEIKNRIFSGYLESLFPIIYEMARISVYQDTTNFHNVLNTAFGVNDFVETDFMDDEIYERYMSITPTQYPCLLRPKNAVYALHLAVKKFSEGVRYFLEDRVPYSNNYYGYLTDQQYTNLYNKEKIALMKDTIKLLIEPHLSVDYKLRERTVMFKYFKQKINRVPDFMVINDNVINRGVFYDNLCNLTHYNIIAVSPTAFTALEEGNYKDIILGDGDYIVLKSNEISSFRKESKKSKFLSFEEFPESTTDKKDVLEFIDYFNIKRAVFHSSGKDLDALYFYSLNTDFIEKLYLPTTPIKEVMTREKSTASAPRRTTMLPFSTQSVCLNESAEFTQFDFIKRGQIWIPNKVKDTLIIVPENMDFPYRRLLESVVASKYEYNVVHTLNNRDFNRFLGFTDQHGNNVRDLSLANTYKMVERENRFLLSLIKETIGKPLDSLKTILRYKIINALLSVARNIEGLYPYDSGDLSAVNSWRQVDLLNKESGTESQLFKCNYNSIEMREIINPIKSKALDMIISGMESFRLDKVSDNFSVRGTMQRTDAARNYSYRYLYCDVASRLFSQAPFLAVISSEGFSNAIKDTKQAILNLLGEDIDYFSMHTDVEIFHKFSDIANELLYEHDVYGQVSSIKVSKRLTDTHVNAVYKSLKMDYIQLTKGIKNATKL